MLGPLDIHQYLLAHDVHHEIVRLPRTIASADHLAEVMGLPRNQCVAVHPFHAGTPTGDVLVVLLATYDTDLDQAGVLVTLADLLQTELGAAALFPARPDLVSSHTDYLASHLAPLLLPADVLVVACQELAALASTVVYTATGDGGTALGIRAVDLLDLCHAIVLPDAQAMPAASPHRHIDLNRRAASIDLEPHASERRGAILGRSRSLRRSRSDSDEAGTNNPVDLDTGPLVGAPTAPMSLARRRLARPPSVTAPSLPTGAAVAARAMPLRIAPAPK
ncbi:MAG: hypothetical protein QOJ62_928 [Actinomycetota bacterium]|jgi:prolyl-tRNA editing enzyme YbaK/EbsC (Cys-tRNA(Pro) deacylase)|nr:hypothetical protein [Actinomycetota bacterium]